MASTSFGNSSEGTSRKHFIFLTAQEAIGLPKDLCFNLEQIIKKEKKKIPLTWNTGQPESGRVLKILVTQGFLTDSSGLENALSSKYCLKLTTLSNTTYKHIKLVNLSTFTFLYFIST